MADIEVDPDDIYRMELLASETEDPEEYEFLMARAAEIRERVGFGREVEE